MENEVMTIFGMVDKRYIGQQFKDTDKWVKLMKEAMRHYYLYEYNIDLGGRK